jgi:hypothetical protein
MQNHATYPLRRANQFQQVVDCPGQISPWRVHRSRFTFQSREQICLFQRFTEGGELWQGLDDVLQTWGEPWDMNGLMVDI